MARAPRQRTRSRRTDRRPWLVRGVLLAFALMVPGCAQRGASVQGQKVHALYVLIALMAAPVFIAVEGLLIWSLVRFRRRANDTSLPPQTSGSTRALVVFFVIPAVIVA